MSKKAFRLVQGGTHLRRKYVTLTYHIGHNRKILQIIVYHGAKNIKESLPTCSRGTHLHRRYVNSYYSKETMLDSAQKAKDCNY